MDFISELSRIINRAEEILSEYPLCDHCLGRLFARIGIGISNYERGLVLKTLLSLKLQEDYSQGKLDREKVALLAMHTGPPLTRLFEKLYGERVNAQRCYICGNMLSKDLFEKIARESCSKIHEYNPRSFVIGVSMDKEIIDRELEILVKYGIDTSESIKRELKREIGKIVKEICSITPDFSRPDVVVHVSVERDFKYSIAVHPSPLYISLRVWKIGRRIPRYPRGTVDNKGSLSIMGILREIFKESFMAEDVRVKTGGFESHDTRIVGLGRGIIVELKNPKLRDIPKATIARSAQRYSGILVLEPVGVVSKTMIDKIRELSRRGRKTYRVSVFVPEGISEADIVRLEESLKNSEILQVSRSRKVRRRIHIVKADVISSCIFEALVKCDAGVDVKRLIQCNNDEEITCFTRILGKTAIPLEIDLVHVEE